jgi:hypothetical protein
LVMVWAASVPATALAAPALQLGTAEDEAVLLAYYESEPVAPEGEEEGILSLSFYDDDTFEMTATAVDGEVISAAYGDYEVIDDGVTLTFIGADGEDFDEPNVLDLLWDADDTLLIPGAEDALFGEVDILLYPIELEAGEEGGALEEDTGDDTGDDVGEGIGEEGDDDFALTLAGVYVSPIQPYENSDGVVYLLNLLPSGEASLNSDYLDLEAPIFELGTWTDNGDNTVTVEITETLEEVYEESIFIEFEVGEIGELMLADFSLYPIEILSYLEDDEFTDEDVTGEELESDESDVFIYVAEVNPPDEDEPIYIYMFLYDDGSVIMSDADETTTLYGEWIFEDEILAVTLTSDGETTFDEPGELVFEFNEEDALVATEYPVELFGEEELIFYPAADENNDDEEASATEGEFYFYESDVLPSDDTDGILISLVLSGEGDAVISTDFMDDEEAYLEYGEWTRDEDGNIIVTITESQDEDYDEPYVFTFAEDEDDLALTLIEESVEIFGDFGLVLYRTE